LARGGAFYGIDVGSTTIHVTGGSLHDNSAQGGAGGDGNAGGSTADPAVYAGVGGIGGNGGDAAGGGFFGSGLDLTADGTFSDNNPVQGGAGADGGLGGSPAGNGGDAGHGGEARGGSICAEYLTLQLSNVTFVQSYARGGMGGLGGDGGLNEYGP